ncbi:unnamed protein product [Lactuca virosa]|uniref:CCHC-type domain-containing protein n=1 Tax=Lactuca virosa TaxID=75947 RepID=A0AAU9PE78_9ASTR|nr:unnamed protein product [Lactuca virosa]
MESKEQVQKASQFGYKCGKKRNMTRDFRESVRTCNRICYGYSESGHIYSECPKASKEIPKWVGRGDRGNPREERKTDVVIGTFTLNSLPVYVIFEYGVTCSFVFVKFASHLTTQLTPKNEHILVEVLDGRYVLVNEEYHECRLGIYGTEFLINLKPITTREI